MLCDSEQNQPTLLASSKFPEKVANIDIWPPNNMEAEREVPESSSSPVCIPVPLSASAATVTSKADHIIRPIPQRAVDKAASSERPVVAARSKPVEKRSLTDPRSAKRGPIQVSNPVKLRSISPLHRNNNHGNSTTVVSIGGAMETKDQEEDSGYQILSSKDEEAERDTSHHIRHPVPEVRKRGIKPKRKGGVEISTHKHADPDLAELSNVSHLLDVKAAIERLQLHSPAGAEDQSCHSSSESSSAGSTGDPKASVMGRKVTKKATSVTSTADEFVWIDSHNRLVELQQLPWTNAEVAQVVSKIGALQESGSDRVAPDLLPRISYYMQRALVRLTRESQRLAKCIGYCGPREISTAIKAVLSPGVAISALRACIRSAAMFSISGDVSSTRQSKSERAGLVLKVGRMLQWMCLVKVGKFVHNLAAIYLTATMECIIEEVVAKCLESFRGTSSSMLTASVLEQVVASNGDLWGLFQPYAHLSSSRVATGTLTLSAAIESLTTVDNSNNHHNGSSSERNIRQILLTTCVGSVDELEEMVLIAGSVFQRLWSQSSAQSGTPNSAHSYRPMSSASGLLVAGGRSSCTWSSDAINSLYYFMRCSQLEYVGQEGRTPIQELVYERPYMVLPPVCEWVRVATAFAEHRASSLIDPDDVVQAARILLPGMDCPPRSLTQDSPCSASGDEMQVVQDLQKEMAFKLLMTGRRDLVPHALQLLPGSFQKMDIANSAGLTPLQLAAANGDTNSMRLLLDTGANREVTSTSDACDTQNWTPLCFAALAGHYKAVKLLLDRGAKVDAGISEFAPSETPLQLAAGAGHVKIVELLIAHGANPFKATVITDNLPSATRKGSPSAVAVAAIHGHRRLLHLMITQSLSMARSGSDVTGKSPSSAGDEEVLSLAEILAEGVNDNSNDAKDVTAGPGGGRKLSKQQIKRLQEAMYHAAECGHIDLTLDLRNLGVPWTPFTWVNTLKAAHDTHSLGMINELLQDFILDWLDEATNVFLAENAVPTLFNIFKSCKNESTILMLADIFAMCYGSNEKGVFKDGLNNSHKIELRISGPDIKDPPPRIDSRFINNPELSDVQFRVEGRIFYAHKLALITASPRFQSMLNSRFCEGNPPILQINDIRYDIFHLVMTYLYNGGLGKIQVEGGDVLELMAAANFFQLPGLMRHCEVLCAKLVDLDNIVSYYIHAKVYAALDLLDYCEGFLLKNMVTLLTYDESVKRLIFGKKLQNHDVISGLMTNLQRKIQSKSS